MSLEFVGKTEKHISNTILRTLFVSLFTILLKSLQIILFYDKASGLLKLSPISTAFGIVVFLCVAYVVYEYIMLTITVKKLAGYVNMKTQPLIGLSLVVVAICFLFQGIMDILAEITSGKFTMLSSIINVFTIVSAVAYGIQGFEIINHRRKQHFILNMVPVVWSIIILMDVLLTCPMIVSMQSNISKVLCCLLLVLFMYYTARWACGYEQSFVSPTGVFFRISFACLMFISVLPYCIVFLFNVKDSMQNMPYLAMFGLSLYGFVVLLQYMALSIAKIERKYSL